MAGKSRKLTIFDIARLAGVSTATVSRVINNKVVGKEVRARVLKIIEKYEYCPNSFARYLGQRNNARFSDDVTVYSKIG